MYLVQVWANGLHRGKPRRQWDVFRAENLSMLLCPVGFRHRELLVQVPDDLVGVCYWSAQLFAIAQASEVLDKSSSSNYDISYGVRVILSTGRPRASESDYLDFKESDSLFNRTGGRDWWN